MPTPELISIVIPTYNRPETLKRAVKSALAQTDTDIEVFVVDDAGSDQTTEVMRAFADPRVRYVRNPQNLGIAPNFGKGMREAQGEYVLFMGDDDELPPIAAAAHRKRLAQHPEACVSFCDYLLKDENGALTVAVPANEPHGDVVMDRAELLQAALDIRWFVGASMYRKDVVAPLWDRVLGEKYVFDVSLHAQLALQGAKGVYFAEYACVHTKHSDQLSWTKRAEMHEIKRKLMLRLLHELKDLTGFQGTSENEDLKPRKPTLEGASLQQWRRDARRVLRRELANWLVLGARDKATCPRRTEAMRYLVQAVRADPGLKWAWKQLAVALVAPGRLRLTA